jgi:hypothetical protein
MDATAWKEGYTEQAERFWEEYQRTHDISGRIGQTAGIDPESGRIWLGESALEIVDQLDALGIELSHALSKGHASDSRARCVAVFRATHRA